MTPTSRRRSIVAALTCALATVVVAAPVSLGASMPRQSGGPIKMITYDTGDGPTDGDSFAGGTSRRGTHVTYMSFATDLVTDDDNGEADVFVHDVDEGETTLLSRTPAGDPANGESLGPTISPDGRWISYYSAATDLVDADDLNGTTDVYLTRLRDGLTILASANQAGAAGSGESSYPAISRGGRFVAYQSWADDLVDDDTNGVGDIFVLDRMTGETTLITRAPDGTVGDNFSDHPSISRDGRYVTFTSAATNLVSDKTTPWNDIFVHDRATGETSLITRNTAGDPANSNSFNPSISPDGRFVTYMSRASDLTTDEDQNFVGDIFVHDRETGETGLVTRSVDGGTGVAESHEPSISRHGRVITFYSYAWDLVPDDTEDWWGDVFRFDRGTGELVKITKSPDGDPPDFDSSNPHVSANGRVLAFSSGASNLVVGDLNGMRDVFVRRGGD